MIMKMRSLTTIPFAALLLMAPLSASFAQTAIDQTAPAAIAPLTGPAGSGPAGPGPQGRSDHPRCRQHAGGHQGGQGGRAGHHRRGLQIQAQLERIEQRQVQIETMLHQLLTRNNGSL